MPIDYFAESEKFRPDKIRTLLVGEAPPPGGDKYFYLPRILPLTRPIEEDASLPATIFHHYFQERPTSIYAYNSRLCQLKKMGIFLIDIYDHAIKVRNNEDGLNKIIEAIPHLRTKMLQRQIYIEDREIIFLLARRNYASSIRHVFPTSKLIPWKDFRLSEEPSQNNGLVSVAAEDAAPRTP